MSILFYNADVFSKDGILKGVYLGVNGDSIDYIGSDRPTQSYSTTYNMTGKLLIPGLYNMHSHTPMTVMRGVGAGLPLDRWLTEAMFPIEARMTVEDVRVGSAVSVMEMLACGVVSFTDMYDKCLATAEVVLESGIKANLSRAVMGFDTAEKYRDNFRVRESLELFDYVKSVGVDRLKADFSIHGEYTSNERLISDYAEDILGRGGRVHIHLSETAKEHTECKQRNGGRTPAKLFYDCGIFKTPTIAAHCVHLENEDIEILAECGVTVVHCPSSNMKLGKLFYDCGIFKTPTIAAHCVHLENEDIEILAECGVTVVHCPSSNMKLGSGLLNVGRLISAGINVCVGADGSASNNNQNILEEVHIAALVAGVSSSPSVGSAMWLNALTKNGAAAQQRANCGELAVGNRADIVAINMEAAHLRPVHDVNDLLLYSAQASDVCMTMVDGKILYRDGNYLTIDKEKVYYELDRAVERLF